MPALSYESVNAQQTVFDVLRTPCCVGALPEYFRTRPGSLRSVHPSHSVSAYGPRAHELIDGHINDHTPCGANSPFSKLLPAGGQILFLGCGLRPNTSMHAIEEHIEPEYLFKDPVDYTVVLADGSRSLMRVRQHNFAGWRQRYDRLLDVMKYGLRTGRVLQADCYLVETENMWPAALDALRRDPLYFVELI